MDAVWRRSLFALVVLLAIVVAANSSWAEPLELRRDRSLSLDKKIPSRKILRPDLCLLAPRNATSGPIHLEQRLGGCAVLKRNIVWHHANGGAVPYDNWPESRKEELNRLFQEIGKWHDTGASPDLRLGFCLDPGTAFRYSDNFDRLYFPHDNALQIYLAHVAHALYLDAKDLLPWKLFSRHDEEIREILSSDRYFAPIKPLIEGNDVPSGIIAGRDYQLLNEYRRSKGALCDPRVGYNFMENASLIGDDTHSTLVKLTSWLKDYGIHGASASKDGLYLVDRLNKKSFGVLYGFVMAHGCHGAAAMMKDLARSVNIPLLYVCTTMQPYNIVGWSVGSHSGLAYRWKGSGALYCWHTDDIYANGFFSDAYFCANSSVPLSDREKCNLVFDNTWFSKSVFESYGLLFNIHKVQSGVGYDAAGPDKPIYLKQYFDYGYALGKWRPTVIQKELYDEFGISGLTGNYTFNRLDGSIENVLTYSMSSSYSLHLAQKYSCISGIMLNRYEEASKNIYRNEIFHDYEDSQYHVIYGMNPPNMYWQNPLYWKDLALQRYNDVTACYGGKAVLESLQQQWVARLRPVP